MPCEHYKDALIEVAASGTALQGELRAHFSECASCRAAFDEEQSLFAAIDSGLHCAVNPEIPSSLLRRVRARLQEVVAPRFRWVQPLVLASVSAALVFVTIIMVRSHRTTPENVARQTPVVVPVPITPAEKTNPETISAANTQNAGFRVSYPRAARDLGYSAASGNPEVLVPPDEREAFGRLVAVLNERGEVATSLLARAPEKKDKDGLAIVDPVQIPDIEIKPLEGTETETSDGAGEKH